MLPQPRKRPFPAKSGATKDSKRRKLAPSSTRTKEIAGPGGERKRMRLDALAWKSVAIPDQLDDYEGFFGLEEVDDVHVDRDETSGAVTFNVRAADGVNGTGNADGSDDEEWGGFDDEPITNDAKAPAEAKVQSNPEPPPKKQPKSSKTKSSAQSNGAFEALPVEDDDHDDVDVSAWRPLNLSPDLLSSLSKLKFSSPTEIQSASIPEILAGHDVIGKASTGSGKTLAFGIPILEEFLERRGPSAKADSSEENRGSPLALILSPTRELAHQLDKHLKALCSHGTLNSPSIATLTGGLSLQKQQRLLKNADIVIGTPGRLWQVISEGKDIGQLLQSIQFLVIDEADRLLSEGHFKEVEEILNSLDRTDTDDNVESHKSKPKGVKNLNRQTLVFSATFDRNLQRKLSAKASPSTLESNKQSLEYLLKKLNFREDHPKFIDVNSNNQLVSGLKEGLIQCGGMEKDLYLYTLLLLKPNARTLVFVNSVSAVQRIAPFLQNLNLPAIPLHSGMAQKARLRSIERFKAQQCDENTGGSILVATDVAARGLDIPSVQLVIHYHLPRAADTYVHRSGRTARAGNPGSSIIICAPEEATGVRRLVAKVHATSMPNGDTAKQGHFIRTLDLDRRLVSRLKPRATLAKTIADVDIAKTKGKKDDDFFRAAAEELGTQYESDEANKGRRGRGKGREKREKELKELTKRQVGALKAELTGLLAKRVNVGVSEKYPTKGGIDMDELLGQQGGNGREFLGSVQDLGL